MKGAMGRLWWEIVGVGLCEFSGQLLRGETETVDWVLMVVSKVRFDATGPEWGIKMRTGPDEGPASLFITGICFCQLRLCSSFI